MRSIKTGSIAGLGVGAFIGVMQSFAFGANLSEDRISALFDALMGALFGGIIGAIIGVLFVSIIDAIIGAIKDAKLRRDSRPGLMPQNWS